MKRANTFEVVPQTEDDRECLRRLLDASASLWNELTYERRQNYFGDGDVWDTSEYRGCYNGVVGSATVQQVTRKTAKRGGRSSPSRRTVRTPPHRRTGATRKMDESSVPTSATTSTRFSGTSGAVSKFPSERN